jgi:DNA integrity scanning protein DisA with diadenylate cyclase activity
MDACNTKPRDKRPFEEYRKLAREATRKLEPEIEANGFVTWKRVMAVVDREEVVYKLTLKYLRQDGYDIGDYKNPFVRK